jgi:hypothetical protein
MTEDDAIVLAMAVCDLLGESVTEKDVKKAMEKAEKRLEQSRRPPTEAIVTHARRDD